MGRDKALLPFRGGALAKAVGHAVESAAGSTVLVGDPATYAALGFPVIADLYPGEGPLGGILTALRHTSADWNLIVACDMPEISAEFLGRLMAAAESCEGDVLMPKGPSGRPEPLCAGYRREGLQTLADAFARGVRKVTAALAELRVATLPIAEQVPFQNVNTPEDWAGYGAK